MAYVGYLGDRSLVRIFNNTHFIFLSYSQPLQTFTYQRIYQINLCIRVKNLLTCVSQNYLNTIFQNLKPFLNNFFTINNCLRIRALVVKNIHEL